MKVYDVSQCRFINWQQIQDKEGQFSFYHEGMELSFAEATSLVENSRDSQIMSSEMTLMLVPKLQTRIGEDQSLKETQLRNYIGTLFDERQQLIKSDPRFIFTDKIFPKFKYFSSVSEPDGMQYLDEVTEQELQQLLMQLQTDNLRIAELNAQQMRAINQHYKQFLLGKEDIR